MYKFWNPESSELRKVLVELHDFLTTYCILSSFNYTAYHFLSQVQAYVPLIDFGSLNPDLGSDCVARKNCELYLNLYDKMCDLGHFLL